MRFRSCQRVAGAPQQQSRKPLLQANADRRGQRAVDDGQRTRRPTQQDRHGQRTVQRHLEAGRGLAHATTAPPAKEKNDRKNEDAANRTEEHTSELQSLMRISYAVSCLKKKRKLHNHTYSKHYTHILYT